MHQLAKYGIGDLQVVNLKSDQDNELLETITKEFDEVNGIVDTILKQFSEIDSSIREWSNQFYDFASDCVDFVGKLSEASDSSNRDPNIVEGVLALGGMAAAASAAIVGAVGGGIKRYAAKKEMNRQLEESLVIKKQVAREKMPVIESVEMRLVKLNEKIEKLYAAEFARNVRVDDDLLAKKITIFKKSFVMVVKKRLIDDTVKFVKAEMRAWLSGSHNSEYVPLTPADVALDEVAAWSSRLSGSSDMSWEEFIIRELADMKDEIPVPEAFVFTEPAMLKSFVNVQLENCSDYSGADDEKTEYQPIIVMGGESPTMINDKAESLLSMNEFYSSCEAILKDNPMPPYPEVHQQRERIVTLIVLVLAGLSLGFSIGDFCADIWMSSGVFLRILDVFLYIGIIALIVVATVYLPKIIDDHLPSSKKISKWSMDVFNRNYEISKRKTILNTRILTNTIKA